MEEEARRRKQRLAALRTDETPAEVADGGAVATATMEEQAKGVLEEALGLRGILSEESDDMTLESLAPKKANWDLKRDLERSMQKLDKQTGKAINELIRRRLEGEGGE